MSFSVETVIHSIPMADFERSTDFVAQSTAAGLCTFGITVESTPSTMEIDVITKALNKKKLDHLLETLENHRKYVQHFEKNDREVPDDLLKSIQTTQIEIENLRNLLKS